MTSPSRENKAVRAMVNVARNARQHTEENPPQGDYVLLDTYGRILAVAECTARRLAFPADRLVGRRLLHRLTEASRAPFQSTLNRARVSTSWSPLVVRMRAKTNELLEVCLRSATFIGAPAEAMLLHAEFSPASLPEGAPAVDLRAANFDARASSSRRVVEPASGPRRIGIGLPDASSSSGGG